MIKPPFTVLILKKSHRPVTIRVSALLLILICAGIPMLSVIMGFGLSHVLEGTGSARLGSANHAKALRSSAFPARPDDGGAGNPRPAADITSLFVTFTKGGGMDISFSLVGNPSEGRVYVWVVVNPGSSPSGETLIFPRSPVFRGLPLDFRNGVVHDPGREKTCAINITEGLSGISVERLRILIYTKEGTILADKQFNVNQHAGM
jgi:hypothetical protein